MEVIADQIILVRWKISFFIVLQDFPINCSKSLTLIFELRPFSHSRWCLHAGRWILHVQGWGGQQWTLKTWADIHFCPIQDYCYLPLASLADVLYVTEGNVDIFFLKISDFSFLLCRGLLLLLPVLDCVAKKVIQYTCCPSENALVALWPTLQMLGFWKNRRVVLLWLIFL